MDDAYALLLGVLGPGDGQRLPVERDAPAVLVIDPDEDLHHRGLASAVLTQQRMHLPGS